MLSSNSANLQTTSWWVMIQEKIMQMLPFEGLGVHGECSISFMLMFGVESLVLADRDQRLLCHCCDYLVAEARKNGD